MELTTRRTVTFAQAEGAAPLPAQLKVKQISQELRSLLWFVMHAQLEESRYFNQETNRYEVSAPWDRILLDTHIFHYHRMVDEFSDEYYGQLSSLKSLISSGSYIDIFDFLQTVLRHYKCPKHFSEQVSAALDRARAA